MTQSGDALRVTFANPENALPLAIASARIDPATATGDFAAAARRGAAMTFGGRTTVKLAGAAALESDPIALKVRSGEDFILSITTTADSTDVGGRGRLFRPSSRPPASRTSRSRSRFVR